MKLNYYHMHSHRAHTHNPTKYSEQNALLWSCEFPFWFSSSFPAPLPVALYQETLVDQIKEPAQHTLIFTTTLPHLSPHIPLLFFSPYSLALSLSQSQSHTFCPDIHNFVLSFWNTTIPLVFLTHNQDIFFFLMLTCQPISVSTPKPPSWG